MLLKYFVLWKQSVFIDLLAMRVCCSVGQKVKSLGVVFIVELTAGGSVTQRAKIQTFIQAKDQFYQYLYIKCNRTN